jgi:flagellar hook-associated protein FlgK
MLASGITKEIQEENNLNPITEIENILAIITAFENLMNSPQFQQEALAVITKIKTVLSTVNDIKTEVATIYATASPELKLLLEKFMPTITPSVTTTTTITK